MEDHRTEDFRMEDHRMEDQRKTDETVVLCGASSYNEKFYLDPRFDSLPEAVKDELKILCVSITEEAGGILTLEFDPDGSLNFVSRAEDGDYLFDDITSGMRIARVRFERRELLEGLELYYRIRFLHLTAEEAEKAGEE